VRPPTGHSLLAFSPPFPCDDDCHTSLLSSHSRHRRVKDRAGAGDLPRSMIPVQGPLDHEAPRKKLWLATVGDRAPGLCRVGLCGGVFGRSPISSDSVRLVDFTVPPFSGRGSSLFPPLPSVSSFSVQRPLFLSILVPFLQIIVPPDFLLFGVSTLRCAFRAVRTGPTLPMDGRVLDICCLVKHVKTSPFVELFPRSVRCNNHFIC